MIQCYIQVAGYVTEYDQNGFKFVTVKGSGHMVCFLLSVRKKWHLHVHQPTHSITGQGYKERINLLLTNYKEDTLVFAI